MTGRAAHIHGTASGPGSRRYLTSMTPKERKDFSNAIWLCAYHADLIDNDEATYTADDLRAMKREHEAYAQALGNGLDQGAFERGVRAFVADDDTVAAGARLQAIFSDAIALIQDQRTQRLRARPIDQTKWNALIQTLSNALRPELYCFRDFRIENIAAHAPAVMEWRINGIDKGKFVTPVMSWESVNDLTHVILDTFREALTLRVWVAFFEHQPELVGIDRSTYPDALWDGVSECIERVGQPATLLTTYDPVGSRITSWLHSPAAQQPANRRIEYVQGHPSGGGTGYTGTLDGVEVFAASVEPHQSYLFSARMLQSISYRLVTPDAFISVEFEEWDDPWNGAIVVRYCQCVEWHPTPIVKFVGKEASDQEAADMP